MTGSSQRYYYEIGKASTGTLPLGAVQPSSLDKAEASNFLAAAIGNIDRDATCDVWTIDQDKVLTNATNDVSN